MTGLRDRLRLSLLNVEGRVARSHLRLVAKGSRDLDAYYLSTLNADIVPALREFQREHPEYSKDVARVMDCIVTGQRWSSH